MNSPSKKVEIELEKKKEEHQSVIKKSRSKYPGFRKNLRNYVQDFTENTTVHGLKYIGEQNRTIIERLCWVIFFCLSLYTCVDLIIKTYTKWNRSPVLLSFANDPTYVWQIPFPAITICPLIKIRQSAYNYSDAFYKIFHCPDNMTVEEVTRISDSGLVCSFSFGGGSFAKLDTVKYFMSVAPQLNDTFIRCNWNTGENCEHLFTPTLTNEGLCFTFNILERTEILRSKVHIPGNYMSKGSSSKGWTLEDGYPSTDESMDTFPRRVMTAGVTLELFLIAREQDNNMGFLCSSSLSGEQGFRILLHHPAEMPQLTTRAFGLPFNKQVTVSIRPDLMTTSEGLREYDPHRRGCYFPTEKYLSFFLGYTQQNCQLECLANFTLASCGCVAYYMPRENTTKICGGTSKTCMTKANTRLLEKEFNSSMKSPEGAKHESVSNCDCLPACTSLTYNSEISQSEFELSKLQRIFGATDIPGLIQTQVRFFFKEHQFLTTRRNELYGQTEFLANCGGILGLFTGFSFLSIVEILYFLSLRLMCNVKRFGRHYWSGTPTLVEDEDKSNMTVGKTTLKY